MTDTCLQVTVTLRNMPLSFTIGEFCGAGLNYWPLLVDEGILYIDFRDGESQLFVSKK